MRRGQFFLHFISRMLQGLMVLYVVIGFYKGDYFWTVVGVFFLLLALIPMAAEKKFHITLPVEINFLATFILYLHLGGGVRGWYELFPWYDKVTHFLSSAAVAAIGFMIVVIIDQYVKDIKINRQFITFFVIIFTMTVGAFWEIGEFTADQIFGSHWQAGLTDTMYDLICDLIGGIIVGAVANFYLKYVPREHFIKEWGVNPQTRKTIQIPAKKAPKLVPGYTKPHKL